MKLTRVEKNENLQNWFLHISKEISNLTSQDIITNGRRIVLLIDALKDIEPYHQMGSNLQVKVYLTETATFLSQMLSLLKAQESTLIKISVVADFSYAWKLAYRYINAIHLLLQKSPKMVIKLRAVFMKMFSVLDLPLVRILEAKISDELLLNVSRYYSGKLLNFVEECLNVIPKNIFMILNDIVDLLDLIKPIPFKVAKAQLNEFSQNNERMKLSELVYSIAVFTEGMMVLEKTFVGVIQIDPKKLLAEGIRKELIVKLVGILELYKPTSGKTLSLCFSEFNQNLSKIESLLKKYSLAFEYIQDYLFIYAFQMW
jgi:WASH complex subunit strumpellin